MAYVSIFNRKSYIDLVQVIIESAKTGDVLNFPEAMQFSGAYVISWTQLFTQVVAVTHPDFIKAKFDYDRRHCDNFPVGRTDVLWAEGLIAASAFLTEVMTFLTVLMPSEETYITDITRHAQNVYKLLGEAEAQIAPPEKAEEAPELPEGSALPAKVPEWTVVGKRKPRDARPWVEQDDEPEAEVQGFIDSMTPLGNIPWKFESAATRLMYFPPSNYYKEKLVVGEDKQAKWVEVPSKDTTKYPKDQIRFRAKDRGGFLKISEQSPFFIDAAFKAGWIPPQVVDTFKAAAAGTLEDATGVAFEDTFPDEVSDSHLKNPVPNEYTRDAHLAFLTYIMSQTYKAMDVNLDKKKVHYATWFSAIIRTDLPCKFEILHKWSTCIKGIARKNFQADEKDKKAEDFDQKAYNKRVAGNIYNRTFSSFLSATMCNRPKDMTLERYLTRTHKSRHWYLGEEAAGVVAIAYKRTAAGTTPIVPNSAVGRLMRAARAQAEKMKKEIQAAASQEVVTPGEPKSSDMPVSKMGRMTAAIKSYWSTPKGKEPEVVVDPDILARLRTRKGRRDYKRKLIAGYTDVTDSENSAYATSDAEADDEEAQEKNARRVLAWRERMANKRLAYKLKIAKRNSWWGRVKRAWKGEIPPTASQKAASVGFRVLTGLGISAGVIGAALASPWLIIVAPLGAAVFTRVGIPVSKYFGFDLYGPDQTIVRKWGERVSFTNTVIAGITLAIAAAGTGPAIGLALGIAGLNQIVGHFYPPASIPWFESLSLIPQAVSALVPSFFKKWWNDNFPVGGEPPAA